MDIPQRVSEAKVLKEDGVKLFQTKDYLNAVTKFEEGFSLVDKTSPKDINQDVKDIQLSLLLNMSNCYNNLKNYSKTIKTVEKALKVKENAKSYYYRGIAYANLDEFSFAEEDYNSLSKLVPQDDPGVTNLKNLIEQRKSQKETKEKVFLKNCLKIRFMMIHLSLKKHVTYQSRLIMKIRKFILIYRLAMI